MLHLLRITTRNWRKSLFLLGIISVCCTQLQAQMHHGNLIVCSPTGGTSAASVVKLYQYTTSGSLVDSTVIPSTGASELTNSGSASSEGYITLSAEKDRLVLVGYADAAGAASVASSTVNREIATVDSTETYTLQYTQNLFSGNNIRGGCSYAGNFFAAGAISSGSGLELMNTSSLLETASSNNRSVNIYAGNVYFTSGSGSYIGVNQMGTGIATGTAQAVTNLTTSGLTNPYAFSMSPNGLILYVADATYGIIKFTRTTNSGVFTLGYTVYGTACSGICVDYTTTNPTIYATLSSGLSLISFQDAGSTVSGVTTLATTSSTQYFRGVSFAPSTYGGITASSSSICTGGSTTINFTGNPHGIITYSVNGTPTTVQLDSAYGMASITTPTLSATTTYALSNIQTPYGTTTLSGSVTITVASPAAISGNTTCAGSTTTLTDATTGGTWSSASTGVATIGTSSGVMTGVTAGTAVISYIVGAGCSVTTTANILPAINLITSSGNICALTTTTLGDLTPSGTWSSSNTAVATIGAATGALNALVTGTSIITYVSPAACMTTATETVISSSAGTISGFADVCLGVSTTMSSSVPGGIWSSSNTAVGSVGSLTGIVSGIASGSFVLSYTFSNTCGSSTATFPMTAGNITVPTPVVRPSSLFICASSPAQLISASSDTTYGSVIASSTSASFTIPLNSADSSSVTISTVPAGATITSITVAVNVSAVSSAYQSDNGFNLRAPNGSIINLDNFHGSSSGAFTNVTYGSAGTVAQSSATETTGNVYIASLVNGAPTSGSYTTTGYRANATSWASLYGVPNGKWTFLTDNDYNATEDTFKSWTITINYAMIPAVTWSPVAGLYTNTGGSTPYASGASTSSIYALPTASTTYTVTANMGGCTSAATSVVTYGAGLPAITGNVNTCIGSSTTLADGVSAGAWTSGSTATATVDPTLGVVTGVATGTVVITYTEAGCITTTTASIAPAVPIAGGGAICQAATTSLSTGTAGTWSSSNTAVVAISGSFTGVSSININGVSGGTSIISYVSPVGCTTLYTETVNPFPIMGNASACVGTTTTLSDVTTGGTWLSTNTGVATVGSATGIITGVANGTTTISYTLGACNTAIIETISPAVNNIAGAGNLCTGASTALGDATTGGSWFSSNTAVATIGTSSGTITGVTYGSTIITYMLPIGCYVTAAENILPNTAGSISGTAILCTASNTTLSDATPGGSWSSSNTSVATVNSATGVVNGASLGTALISYNISNSCGTYVAASPVTVTTFSVPAPMVNPLLVSLCPTSTARMVYAYGDTISGSVTATSTSSYFLIPKNSADSSSVNISGIPAGATITGINVTVTSITPKAGSTVYQSDNAFNLRAPNGSIINLDDFHGSSSGGFTNVTYSSAGTVAQSTSSEVAGNQYIASLLNAVPATIGSYASNATTWASLYNAPNGKWTFITDNDYSATEDTFNSWSITISYAYYPSVTWSPATGLFTNTGATTPYAGSTASSVYALPTSTTTYSVTANVYGCTSATTFNALVNPTLYVPVITGSANVCAAATANFSDSTTGGTWTSSNTGVVTIGSATGIANGVGGGTAAITYSYSSGTCSGYSVKSFTVNPLPVVPAISGATSLCLSGSPTGLLTDGTLGGSWTSNNTAVATIGATSGELAGVSPGNALISYSYSNGICSNMVTTTVTVANSPSAMTISPSAASQCAASPAQMLVANGGNLPAATTVSSGTLSFAIPYSTAGVTTSLTVTGIPAGATVTGIAVNYNATESFDGDFELNLMAPNGQVLNLFSSGTANSGSNFVNTTISSAATTAIPNANAGAPWTGVWAANGGIVDGAGALVGSSVYSVTTTNWLPLEAANPDGTWVLAGRDNYSGNSATLTSWSLTISYTYQAGVTWTPVTGLYTNTGATTPYGGTATNTVYALPTTTTLYTATGANGACGTTANVNVHYSPTLYIPVINGSASLCAGTATTLTDSLPGGTWMSSNTSVASVGSTTGMVTSIGAGTSTITFTYSNGTCTNSATKVITVNALPTVAAISGNSSICTGVNATYTDGTTGGTWSSSAPAILAVNATSGVASAMGQGSATISYTYSNGTCANTVQKTVMALYTPSALTIMAASPAICANGPADQLVVTGGYINGTYTASSTSAPFVETVFGDANTSPITVSGIPAGSVITSVSVNFTVSAKSSQYQTDNIFNLEAPNGEIINLDNESGAGSGGYSFNNIMISSYGTTALGTSEIVSGISYGADMGYGVGPTSPTDLRAAATAWSQLYSMPNGAWTFVPTNDYNATEDTFKNWTLTINYLQPVTTTWTNTTGLYTDMGASMAYASSSTDTVYAMPAATTMYTVTAANGSCMSTDTATVTINPLPAAISGSAAICQSATQALTDASIGGTWASSNTTVATVSTALGTLMGIAPGTAMVTYALITTGCQAMTTVTVNSLPNVYNLSGGGSYCAAGSGVDVALSGTDAGDSYQLFIDATLSGAPLAGLGDSLDFGNQTTAGYYTAVATNTVTGCFVTMSGTDTVTINALPTLYSVINGGSYCAGDTGVHIGLSNSENGINYQLFNVDTAIGAALSGAGTMVDFGLYTVPGSYTIVATNSVTGCWDNMTGSADVTINPLPVVYILSGGGNYCSGSTGADVMLSGSGSGVNYQLYDNGATIGAVMGGTGLSLDFGAQTDTGYYTVMATNTGTTCADMMADSAHVGMNVLPNVYAITGGGSYCPAGSGVHIGLAASDNGIKYQLYMGATAEGTSMSGSGSALDFGLLTPVGAYTVQATDSMTGCQDAMSGIDTVSLYSLPTAFNVMGTGSYCNGGTGVDISLSSSLGGDKYQLYLMGAAIGGWMTGSGSGLDFGLQMAAGGYTVVAMDTVTTCTNMMNDTATVTINPLPTAYVVSGGGAYCAGGAGETINLSGSASGISYQLYLGTTAIGTAMPGSGSTLAFGPDTAAGTYKVMAVNTGTTCASAMSDSAVVTINALPVGFTVTGGGAYCASGSGEHIYLSGSDTGIRYQLNFDGSPLGSAVSGSGSILDFGLRTLAGSYTVSAQNNYTLCSDAMIGSSVIVVNPSPAAYTVTGGGSFCAGGAGLSVMLSNSNTGISYQLMQGGVSVGSAMGTGTLLVFGPETTAGYYKIMATDTTSLCADYMTDSVAVNVNPLLTPSVTITAVHGVNVCTGMAATFNAMVVNGGTAPIYRWYVDGFYYGTDSSSFTYTPTAGDVVTAIMISNVACPAFDTASSDSLTMSVMANAAPTIHIAATPGNNICYGAADTVWAVTTYGGASPVFKWYVNGVLSSGADSEFVFTPVSGDVVYCNLASSYTCLTVADTSSNYVTVTTVTPVAPIVTVVPYPGANMYNNYKDSLVAYVIDGGTAPSYQWFVNDTLIAGATNAVYVSSNFKDNDSVSCRVTRNDPCGLSSYNGLYLHHLVTGVTNVSAGNVLITVNPNPNKGTFMVKGDLSASGDQDVDLVVTDLLGQEVYVGKAYANNGEVSETVTLGSNIANGMYLLTIHSAHINEVVHLVVAQ